MFGNVSGLFLRATITRRTVAPDNLGGASVVGTSIVCSEVPAAYSAITVNRVLPEAGLLQQTVHRVIVGYWDTNAVIGIGDEVVVKRIDGNVVFQGIIDSVYNQVLPGNIVLRVLECSTIEQPAV